MSRIRIFLLTIMLNSSSRYSLYIIFLRIRCQIIKIKWAIWLSIIHRINYNKMGNKVNFLPKEKYFQNYQITKRKIISLSHLWNYNSIKYRSNCHKDQNIYIHNKNKKILIILSHICLIIIMVTNYIFYLIFFYFDTYRN